MRRDKSVSLLSSIESIIRFEESENYTWGELRTLSDREAIQKLRCENLLRNIGVRFTRADALLEEGMIVCVHCGSKYSKLLERCPNPECPPRGKDSRG